MLLSPHAIPARRQRRACQRVFGTKPSQDIQQLLDVPLDKGLRFHRPNSWRRERLAIMA